MSVTIHGGTFCEVDVGVVSQVREPWEFTRQAGDMSRVQRKGANRTRGCWLLPGGVWTLKPGAAEPALLTTTDYEPTVIGSAAVNIATGIASYYAFRKPTDLTGIAADASVVAQGITKFQKRVAASGATWATAQLVADVLGFPKALTEDPTPLIPTDRVLVGIDTHKANDGYYLEWTMPEGWDHDAPLTFYFGGRTDIREPTGALSVQTGGQYCLVFRGSGLMSLQELDRSTWEERDTMRYAMPDQVAGYRHRVYIIPYGTANLATVASSLPFQSDQGLTALGLLTTLAAAKTRGAQAPTSDYYLEKTLAAGHYHTQTFTGPGEVRLDIQRSFRDPFSIARLKYPTSGTLVDAPFLMPFTLPTDTPITLFIGKWLLPGTSVTGALYNADTHVALSTNLAGQFLSHANQRRYYAKFTLNPSSDRFSTPCVTGYAVAVAGATTVRAVTPFSSWVSTTSVQGPDWVPGSDQATLKVQDETALDLPILLLRDHIRARVGIKNVTTGALVSYLHEGETVQPVARLRGKPGSVYPATNWRDYDPLRIGSLWGRLERKHSESMKPLGEDSNAPFDPVSGKRPPWKLTDTARWAFNHAGVPDDELDIPDLHLRWWGNQETKAEDFIIQYGQPLAPLIDSIGREYLGGTWIFDPNAGPRGRWRLLLEPQAPYSNFLAHFHLTNPGGLTGKDVTFAGSYAAGHTFIEEGSYSSFVKAPEGNAVTVWGITNGGGNVNAVLVNWHSLNDPTHSDYLDEGYSPIVRAPDPGLQTQQAVTHVAWMIYNRACHAQKCFEFRAPLMLVTNPLDPLQVRPRPLRIGDLVYVEGTPALIRNCHMQWDTDHIQMCTYEGRFLT